MYTPQNANDMDHKIAHEHCFGFDDEEWNVMARHAGVAANVVAFATAMRASIHKMEYPEAGQPSPEDCVVAGRFRVLLWWMAYDTDFADHLFRMLLNHTRSN